MDYTTATGKAQEAEEETGLRKWHRRPQWQQFHAIAVHQRFGQAGAVLVVCPHAGEQSLVPWLLHRGAVLWAELLRDIQVTLRGCTEHLTFIS